MPRRESGKKDEGPRRRRSSSGHSSRGHSSRGAPRKRSRAPHSAVQGPANAGRESAALEALIRHLPRVVDPDQLVRQFADYLDELRSWNARGNLVAPGDLGRLVERHVTESLAALPIVDRLAVRELIDLGSGGGFPGVPLKLARPELDVALVESRRLKALFLRRVGVRLGLERLWVWTQRAEPLAQLPGAGVTLAEAAASTSGESAPSLRPLADLITARAVAPLVDLARWAEPLVKPGGRLLTFKGSRLEEELAEWRRERGLWELEETSPGGAGIQLVLLRRD